MDAQLYEDYRGLELDHWWFTARRTIFHRLLRSLDPPPTPVIVDIGPGAGVFTAQLREYGAPLAVEFDAGNAAFVRTTTDLDVVHASATAMPLAGQSVGWVIAGDVLEHIPDDHAAVREIARILHPGGCALITVPAHPSLWGAHDAAAHHQRRYTEAGLRHALSQNGLEVDYLTPYNALLLPPIAAVRGVQRLRGRASVARSDFALPPRVVNRILHTAFAAEAPRIAHRRRVPFGLSLLALVRPRSGDAHRG